MVFRPFDIVLDQGKLSENDVCVMELIPDVPAVVGVVQHCRCVGLRIVVTLGLEGRGGKRLLQMRLLEVAAGQFVCALKLL